MDLLHLVGANGSAGGLVARSGEARGVAATVRSIGRARRLALALALLGATLAVYANVLPHPFLFDSVPLVLENPDIRSVGNLPEIVGLGPEGPRLRNRWPRFVTYALEYAAVGPRPLLYQLDNVLLHAAVGLLLFALLLRMNAGGALAGLAAALFLLHPVNTDVVTQVAGRRELLAALFALATLHALLHWVRARASWALAAGLVLLYLASYSKEVGLLAGPAFLLVDAYRRPMPEEGAAPAGRPIGRVLGCLRARPGTYGGLAAATLGLAAALLFASSAELGLSGSPGYYEATGASLGLLERSRLAGLGLRLLLVPVGLSGNYGYDALGLAEPGLGALAVLDLAVLAGALALTLGALWRGGWLGFAGAWYALFYLPHAGIIPWHAVFAERFLYLCALGVCVGAAAALRAAFRALRLRRGAAAGCALVVLVVLGVGTVQRNRVWADPETFWQSVVARYPRTVRAHRGLGYLDLEAGHPAEALAHFRDALEIFPEEPEARLGTAAALLRLGRADEAAAMLEPALERSEPRAKALVLQGYLRELQGEPTAAVRSYERALERDPDHAPAYNNLARHRAMQGELREAIRLYEAALRADPAFETALGNLAALYRHGLGDEAKAARYERRAERLRRARGTAPDE